MTVYAYGTRLDTAGPWQLYSGGRALCSDGVIRPLAYVAHSADTWFSVPAAVRVSGRYVAGYVSTGTLDGSDVYVNDDDPRVVKFHRFDYGPNHDALPAGSWNGTRQDFHLLAPVVTRRDGIAYLTTDAITGEDNGHLRVPCSRYGRTSRECAPTAWRVAYLVARDTGEAITRDKLDHAMGLVVNDHDDVSYMIRTYGRYDYGR